MLITDVDEDSPAWHEGLRPDMMISHVAGNRVASPREFEALVAGESGPVKVRLHDRVDKHPERTIPPSAG